MDDRSETRRADILKAVAHPTRIAILEILRPGEECVCRICPELEGSQPNTSKHLATMKAAGILSHGGFEFGNQETIDALRSLLVPLTTVLTPNIDEIKQLAPTADSVEACANELLDSGCQLVLLTGTHAQTPEVINKLFSPHGNLTLFSWPRIEHSFHGSGCTLAASLSGYLAHGLDLREAIQQAQRFTWESLNYGTRIGFGEHIPNRSAWSQQD